MYLKLQILEITDVYDRYLITSKGPILSCQSVLQYSVTHIPRHAKQPIYILITIKKNN